MRLIPRCITTLMATLVIAGCNIDEGTSPISLELRNGATGETDRLVIFQCSEARPQAVLAFSNGAEIDLLSDFFLGFSTEVASSDESVFKVSNGDLEIPGNPENVYRKGVLLPVAPGEATLTIRYSDYEDSIAIEVRGPDAIEVRPQQQTVALSSSFDFRAIATQDGEEVDISSGVLWTLVDASGEPVDIEVGGINAGAVAGRVAAFSEADGLVAKATLTACADFDQLPGTVDPEDLTADVSFQVPETLTLSREFEETDPDTGEPMVNAVRIQGTSEQYSVSARFAAPEDGTQDLTNFVTFDIVEPGLPDDEVTDLAGTILGIRGLISMIDETSDPLQVTARYGSDEPPEEGQPTPPPLRSSNTLTLEIVEGVLQTLEVDPIDPVVAFGERQQFTGTGIFLLADEVTTLSQVITRHISWTSSDTDVGVISSQVSTAGLSQVLTEAPGCTFITAVPLADPEQETRTRLFANDDTAECVEPPEAEG